MKVPREVIAGRRAVEIHKEEPEEGSPTGYKGRGTDKKGDADGQCPSQEPPHVGLGSLESSSPTATGRSTLSLHCIN